MMGVGSAFGRQPSWAQMKERIRMGLITPTSVLMSSVSLPTSPAGGALGDPSTGSYIPQVRTLSFPLLSCRVSCRVSCVSCACVRSCRVVTNVASARTGHGRGARERVRGPVALLRGVPQLHLDRHLLQPRARLLSVTSRPFRSHRRPELPRSRRTTLTPRCVCACVSCVCVRVCVRACRVSCVVWGQV